ncbi:MAG TPA: glycerophosphodiester phosphodiesterase family protein [Pseudogracilibacillus sp.]|nr:glycerophosphodiester phosphodiesterase family protein [Pseudogracilibacillus sp.]
MKQKKTKIIGHRGFMSQYVENSLEGFIQAAELGIDGVELDVHLTRDGEVVVHHDETINRITTGSGYIQALTVEELKQYPFRSRKASGETIPTLEEVLIELSRWPDFIVNIELKTHRVLYKSIEEKVYQLVKAYGDNLQIIYSSFHLPTLIRMKQLDETSEVAFITQQQLPHMADYVKILGLDGIHPRKNLLLHSPEAFQNCGALRPWTVNRLGEMRRFFASNVDAIITKFPERALRLRDG